MSVRWLPMCGIVLLGVAATRGEPASPDADQARTIIRSAAQRAWTPKKRPADAKQREAYERWLKAHRESVEDVEPSPEMLFVQPWGVCTMRTGTDDAPTRLYLHVFDWHASGKVVVYGLTGGVTSAFLLGDQKRAKLELSKADEKWVAVLGPKQAPDPLDSVVVLEIRPGPSPLLPTDRVVVAPLRDGTVPLFAKDAVVHGRTLRYEPEPNKDTIGYWTDPSDWVEWRFDSARAGEYDVEIRYGCGKGSGGSEVEFSLGAQKIRFVVEETGGFQKWVDKKIGRLHMPPPGVTATLEVRARKKPGLAVMDLQQVTLATAGRK